MILQSGGRRTIVDLFLENVNEHSERAFIRFAGREYSYGAIGADTERFAALLGSIGVGRGDRVALAMTNRPAFVISFLGILRCGATAVPLNTLYKPDEYRYALEHSACKSVVTEPSLVKPVKEASRRISHPIARLVVAPDSESTFAIEELRLSDGDCTAQSPLPAAEDLAGIFYTSGTTARPKGVMISHANMVYSAEVTIRSLGLGPDDVPLLAFPLFHVNSLFYGVLSAILLGGALGLLPGFSVSRYWSDAGVVGATWTPGITGPLIRLLLRQEQREEETRHKMRFAVGGSFLSLAELEEFAQRFGVRILPAWSMTETVSLGTLHPNYRAMRIPTTTAIGFPTLGQEIRLLRENGSDSPLEEPGEIFFRSPSLFKGYLNDPEATVEAFAEGGWFRTGDLAKTDERGYLTFVDRKKEMIKSKGENVAAAEVERVLNEHPGVLESAVIGVREDQGLWGERIEAFVVKGGDAQVDEDSLTAFAREKLADFKVPQAIHFVGGLPKTPLGKIQRAELKRARTEPKRGGK